MPDQSDLQGLVLLVGGDLHRLNVSPQGWRHGGPNKTSKGEAKRLGIQTFDFLDFMFERRSGCKLHYARLL